jgi:serine/threonine-protein kinase
MPAPVDTPLPPRYRDARPVAQGGMGEILRATDQELGRDVAVKVLSKRYAQDDALRERFRREALAAARLSGNPNIVTIYDVGEHEGRPLIVMEYLPGGSIEQRIGGRAPCPPAQVIEWLEDAAAALDAAHAAGVVHRDVKPGNLLLDEHGRVHVADFGIASAAGLDSFTQTGTILGTAGYLSPEQAMGERAGAASDRYSLAVVAWELLTGRRPFAARSPTAEAAAHIQAPVPAISRASPSLPRGFDPIFERALAKDPSARYPSAAEFVGSLRRALHDDAGDTWIEPAPTVAVAPPRRSGTRWLIPLGLALLVAAGVVAAILATHNGGGNSPSGATKERTIVRTVTGPGVTVQQTVTAPAQATESSPPTTATAPSGGGDGVSLNDAGYAKMQAGDYQAALPLFEQAVSQLQGTGSTAEAYADYNLAYTRYALGRCTDVVTLLDRSEGIQGKRPEITKLRHDAQKSGC